MAKASDTPSAPGAQRHFAQSDQYDGSLADRIAHDSQLADCAAMVGAYLQEAGITEGGVAAMTTLIEVLERRLLQRADEALDEIQALRARLSVEVQ